MGSTLSLYLLRQHGRGFLLIGIGLTLIFAVFDVIAEFEDVTPGRYESIDAFLVVLMTMPKRLVDLSAFICMLGAFLTLANLTRTHEIVAIRAAGVSRLRVVGISLTAVGLLLVLLGGVELAGRPLYQSALKYRSVKLTDQARLIGRGGLWFRDDKSIVNVGTFLQGGASGEIRIFDLGEGLLIDRFRYAAAANAVGDSWLLTDGLDKRYTDHSRVVFEAFDARGWSPPWESVEVFLELPPESRTMVELAAEIDTRYARHEDAGLFEAELWSRVSLPLRGLAFSLLAAAIALRGGERGSLGRRMVVGLVVGVLLFLVTQLMTNAALVSGLPVAVAVLLPAAVVAAVGVVVLRTG